MDRMITTTIDGEARDLNYSIEVMFKMTEKYGSITTALDIIEKGGTEGFEAVRWFAIQMVNDAELCRRAAGYDPKPMLKEDSITMHIRPIDFEYLTANVVDAISLGYKRETKPDEEVDLGLAELNAKKVGAGA